MAYLNLDPDYFTHRKTLRLIGLLGKDADVIPIRLWSYCAKHHPTDGVFKGYSIQEIESIAGWGGEPGKCVEKLTSVGFMEKMKESYGLHGWKEHEGHIIAFKKRGIKANRIRWKKIKDEYSRNPSRSPKSDFSDPPTSPVQSSPNLPNQSKSSSAERPNGDSSKERVKQTDLDELGTLLYGSKDMSAADRVMLVLNFSQGFLRDGKMPSPEYLKTELKHLSQKVKSRASSIKGSIVAYWKTTIENFHKERAAIRC